MHRSKSTSWLGEGDMDRAPAVSLGSPKISFSSNLVKTVPCASQMVESESGIPKHVVIAFVEELERAHQYFLFKEHLRTDCGIVTHASFADDVSYELTRQNELTQRFPLVEEDDIYDVVHRYILELEAEHWKVKDDVQHASLADDVSYELTWQNELKQEFPLVEEDVIYHVVHKYILELEAKRRKVEDGVQAKDLYAINNAVHYLLFRTREEGYILDEKPEKELEMLKKFAPLTYSVCSAPREPPVDVEARTAIVSNISLEASEKDLRLFFRSFGCIKKFEVKRKSKGQIVHVTFKDLKDVAYLKTYKGFRLPNLSKCIESGYAPLRVHVNSVHDANNEKMIENIGELYSKALAKYDEIKKYCYRFLQEDGKANDKEEWWGTCQWMSAESWANGGYTVCGKYVRLPDTPGIPIKRRLRVIGMGRFERRLGSRMRPTTA